MDELKNKDSNPRAGKDKNKNKNKKPFNKKPYQQRKPKPQTDKGGSAGAESSTTVSSKSDLKYDVMLDRLQYHPTNGMPTTPLVGGRLTGDLTPGYQDVMAGALQIDYIPVLGTNKYMTQNSTMRNVAANIWNSLRNFCTTAQNYQPGDVLNIIFQIGQIPMMCATALRRMKSAKDVSTMYNYYERELYPMLNSSGAPNQRAIDIAAMSDYVSTYNSIVQMYNDIAMPDFFPIFRRWETLQGTVYCDIEPDKDRFVQYIFFNTDTYYKTKYADPSIPGTQMDPHQMPGDIKQLLEAIQQLIDKIYEDSDVRQILADLRNTYGDNDSYKMEPITIETVKEGITPVYDIQMLMSLYYATIMPCTVPTLNVNVNSGALEGTYDVGFTTMSATDKALCRAWAKLPKLYNAFKWDTTVDEFVKNTVWTIQQDKYDPQVGLKAPGPEILTEMHIWGYDIVNNDTVLKQVTYPSNVLALIRNSTYPTMFIGMSNGKIAGLHNFAWAPIMYTTEAEFDASGEVSYYKVFCYDTELEYPVILDSDNVKQWHDALREAVWGLPIPITYKVR